MIPMKCYKDFYPLDEPIDYYDNFQARPAKMLGSAIYDGRYNGVSDGQAGLLRAQYDDPESSAVDPLSDMSTDVFALRSNNKPVATVTVDSPQSESPTV